MKNNRSEFDAWFVATAWTGTKNRSINKDTKAQSLTRLTRPLISPKNFRNTWQNQSPPRP